MIDSLSIFKKKFKQRGFTLAELIISIAIIGLVAALTITKFTIDYQKMSTVVKLKKTYTTLSQATIRAMGYNGAVTGWDISNTSSFAEKYLIPYLKISKNCKTDKTGECDYTFKIKGSNDTYSLDRYGQDPYKFFLNDGSLIIVEAIEDITCYTNQRCRTVRIRIDTNGQKKPNQSGRDLFTYRYIINHPYYPNNKGQFIPNYLSGARKTLIDACIKRSDHDSGCTALIMKDGWRIADDYPW